MYAVVITYYVVVIIVSHIQRITYFGCQLEKVLYTVAAVSPAARGLLNKEKRLFAPYGANGSYYLSCSWSAEQGK